jgi:hypothetical protein
MFAYDALARHPHAFRSLTGMSPADFQRLLDDFAVAWQRARRRSRTTRCGQPRQRTAGAGRRFQHDLRHRLLMALVWLRVYPTYELLGFFFSLHKRNAQLNVRAVLTVLESLDDFPFDRPGRDRRPLSSPEQVMTAFPQVRLVIDTKEQRVHRPGGGFAAQKPYYSGKKKVHTLKVQLTVGPDGCFEAVGPSTPGGSKHDRTLRKESGLLERLAAGEAVMADKAYEPLQRQYPEVELITPLPARRGHPLTAQQQVANRFISRYRVVVEHAIAQLNRYTVLRQVYRGRVVHHGQGHTQVVRVVAVLVNRRTRVQPLKRYSFAA